VARGFFDVDVLAGEAALDREEGVPVVRRRHHEGVDRGIGEQFAVVPDQLRHFSRLRPHLLAALREDRVAHVAEVGHLAVGFGEETAHDRVAPAADPDAGDRDPVIGGSGAQRGRGGGGGEDTTGSDEGTTGEDERGHDAEHGRPRSPETIASMRRGPHRRTS
jgi:hypothetical protein